MNLSCTFPAQLSSVLMMACTDAAECGSCSNKGHVVVTMRSPSSRSDQEKSACIFRLVDAECDTNLHGAIEPSRPTCGVALIHPMVSAIIY